MNYLPRVAHFWQIASLFAVLVSVPTSLALVQRGVLLRIQASGQRENLEVETRDYRHKLQDLNGDGVSDFQDYALRYSQDAP